MSTVGQVIADPDFGKLSPQDQQGVLAHFDPQFANLNPAEFPTVIQHIRGGSAVPKAQGVQGAAPPRPQVKMQESLLAPSQLASEPDPLLSDLATSGGEGGYSDEGKANVTSAAGATAGGALVAGALAAPFIAAAPKVVEAAQEEIPAAGEKAKAVYPLLQNIFKAFGSGEMAGAQAESSAWKEVMDGAYEAAAEATHAGNCASAAIYQAGANAAKLMSNLHSAYVAGGHATRGVLPAAVGLWMYFDFTRDIYHATRSKLNELTGDESAQADHRPE